MYTSDVCFSPLRVTPKARHEKLSATMLSDELSPWQGVLVEVWLTFILLCVVQGANNVKRKGNVYMPTIIIGSYVTVAVLSGVRRVDAALPRH